MKILIRLFGKLLFLIAFLVWSSTAWAVSADETPFSLTQSFSHSFDARKRGDEWRNWMETVQGYSIVYNSGTGNWEYLLPVGGGWNAPAIVGIDDPVGLGIPKGVVPQGSVGGGGYSPSPPNPAPLSGNLNVLVIGAEFGDTAKTYSAAAVQAIIFATTASVKEYYAQNSYSSVTITTANESSGTHDDGFVGWINVGATHPDTGGSTGVANQQIAKDAILGADPFVDFSAYDADSDGTVEPRELAIVVIVAGFEAASAGGGTPSVWAHKWSMGSVGYPTVDNKLVEEYAQFGEKHGSDLASMGIIAHEMGHLVMNLPDLYDTVAFNGSSEGVGAYGLMGSGSWGAEFGNQSGTSPTHLTAWSKESLGWGTVTVISTAQTINFPSADGNGASIFRFNTSDSNEYFLVENRNFTGYDKGFERWTGVSGHGGLVVYHIDTQKAGLLPTFPNTVNGDEDDKGVDVEEANEGSFGSSMLDTGFSRAHTDIFFFSSNNDSFNSGTIPSSTLKSGSGSGISLMNISANGATMTADFSTSDVAPPVTTANNPGGTYRAASLEVSLNCVDADSSCYRTYYTLDGTVPTTASTRYSSPLTITGSTTLRYFSQDVNGNSENVKTENYVVDLNASVPSLSQVGLFLLLSLLSIMMVWRKKAY